VNAPLDRRKLHSLTHLEMVGLLSAVVEQLGFHVKGRCLDRGCQENSEEKNDACRGEFHHDGIGFGDPVSTGSVLLLDPQEKRGEEEKMSAYRLLNQFVCTLCRESIQVLPV